MAFIGGMLKINPDVYDLLLSLTLLWAAYKVLRYEERVDNLMIKLRIREAYLWGAGIGFASGIIGVGGGIFLSPIILLKRWGDVKSAAATAAAFIFLNSLSGLIGMGVSSQLNLDWSLLTVLIFAIVIGGTIGSVYGSKYAKQRAVRGILAVVLLIAAMKRVIEYTII